jgi:predicted ribosome quality control (RQC) complex YloA/Tae2 family protein
MGMKEKLDDKIKRKEQEILEFEANIREARAYIQALQEATKLLPREEAKSGKAETMLRPGGSAYKAFRALQEAGTPLHIKDILRIIGIQNNKTNRISLGGTLARYSRSNDIFKRTAPNTFALVNGGNEEPPEGFGVPVETWVADEEETR